MSRLATYKGLGAPVLAIENLSTASTRVTLTNDQQGKLLVSANFSSGAAIVLPQPETGMQYNIFFGSDATSAATRIVGNTGDSDIYSLTTAHVDSTDAAVAYGSTAEGAKWLQFTAISDVRWAVTNCDVSTILAAGLQSTTT
jgi:hypothetical protein